MASVTLPSWGFQYFTFSRGACLTTGATATDVDRTAKGAGGIAGGS
jgi:hypothetical protein